MGYIKENIEEEKKKVAAACERSGRKSENRTVFRSADRR